MSLVELTPVSSNDASELIAANTANHDFHRPWASPFTDQVGFDEWFATLDNQKNASLLARCSDDGGLAGVFNFTEIVRGVFQSCYLGFYGMQDYCGRGLMTTGLEAAVEHAFNVLGLHRIEANIRPENVRSIALVRRVGFRNEGYSPNYLFLEGSWRDHERWAITREDKSTSDE